MSIKDLYDLYTLEYARENDDEYGRCGTCKHYSKCNICSDCQDGSEYEFDFIDYQYTHDDELANWIERTKLEKD